MKIPNDLKYTNDHEWVRIEGDVATIGITDFAQGELGDIVYVEVETVDETLDREEVFGTVEAVKTVSDLFSPLSGEIIEFNQSLEDEPEKVNSDPYGEGWMVKIRFSDGQSEEIPDFQRHVIPLMSRLGCNGRACHGHRRPRVGCHAVRRASRRSQGRRLHDALRRGVRSLRRVRALLHGPDRQAARGPPAGGHRRLTWPT